MNDKEIPLFNKDRDRFYKRMSNEQHVMFDSILEVPFTFVEAKAGSGKTTVAFAAGIDMLANGVISKIIYIIKPSKRSYANGYLPGDLEQKTAQLYYAAYDALEVLGFSQRDIQALVNTEQVMLITDNNLRGVNLMDCLVIIDEGQNMGVSDLRLVLTRIHDDSKCVLLGDSRQSDNPGDKEHCFVDYGNYMVEHIGRKVELTRNFRGRLSKIAEEYEPLD